MYFSLKDEHARVKAVMFAGSNRFLKFAPKNGMKVLVRGEIGVFERDGQYQLYVKEMQPDGIGALYQAYEDLKRRLEGRGWFDAARKRVLPKYPRKIGVITSPTGAAIRDIITTLTRRYPAAEICVIPVLVQGEHAAASIAQGIKLAHQLGDLDVLIVGRGGGSIEELWAFNEEIVAEAIVNSLIPIISAVGHETDITIADLVADLRAPTPTAAAELAVPVLAELETRIETLKLRLARSLNRSIEQHKAKLNQLEKRYGFRSPAKLIEQREQQLDHALDRSKKAIQLRIQRKQEQHEQLHKALARYNPLRQVEVAQKDRHQLEQRLTKEMRSLLHQQNERFQYLLKQLGAYSPLNIMTKGYSLVYDETNSVLYRSIKEIEPGQAVSIKMHDGQLDCQVWGIKEESKHE